ncbi:hypothetical protein TSAR_015502 [Trichomalopsis sarcophagae]|uniref:Uncharacterized protein n=1 Tax=Trichomalopsis sarcophagae TaxID=543379 RepID=A0A232ERZ0_9HYME|nr:hypothetical protein TSAR_015502 [Trichomalopsis sarcophagae]
MPIFSFQPLDYFKVLLTAVNTLQRAEAATLMDFLENNKLLTCYQSGFRKNFNTQSALLKITEEIRMGVENGLLTVLMLFDFRKAFDSINPGILLKRMREMNFSDEVIR